MKERLITYITVPSRLTRLRMCNQIRQKNIVDNRLVLTFEHNRQIIVVYESFPELQALSVEELYSVKLSDDGSYLYWPGVGLLLEIARPPKERYSNDWTKKPFINLSELGQIPFSEIC